MPFEKGDIIWVEVEKRDPEVLKHPAVVWSDLVEDGSDFNGIMLTHSEPSERFNNILMLEEHFEPNHEIKFSRTHFVNQVFIKFESWGPFFKAGKLTVEGIEFIDSNLNNSDPITFEDYLILNA
ncbi:hypothetical protein [Fulvivirga lutimaris]|uniref:hypothetical protein n=1 Tax=Fulvivirga lutimaris TaxID=1819566 RepID=UPI0012BD667E|nr:hypothetical protein [Fulvivirga lutimaris]MTI38277.1 hypothetical protein [Fulvivirga lutimaris]